MGFSIWVDWGDENIYEKWDFVGASLMRGKALEHIESCPKADKERECCEIHDVWADSAESSNMPMMNYAYPLETEPDAEEIIKVCEDTNCTVVQNLNDDAYYLALTGGGMDLSQDIALAYIIIEKWIPFDLAISVSTQPNLSQSGEKYMKVMRGVIESLETSNLHSKEKIRRAKEGVKKSLEMDKKLRK